jgi:Tfp pilus assembly PilM family ATPase
MGFQFWGLLRRAMPDILAIHWERRRLRVIEATSDSAPRVNQGFVVEIPDPAPTGWLRDAFRRFGVTARQAVVCVPREDAILRQLELPNAPDDELPTLVHFQASTRSTTPLDQLFLDFLPLPPRAGSLLKDVLVATIPRTSIDPIRSALDEAGVELTSVTISSFALAELVVRTQSTGGQPGARRSLVVLEDLNRLEVVLLGDQQPLMTHLVRPSSDDEGHPIIAKADAEIARVLVPAQPWLVESRIEQICLLGDMPEWNELPASLQTRWDCPVERFDPKIRDVIPGLDGAKLPESIARFAPALGLVLGRTARLTPAFDLLHPRQPKPKQDPRKLQLAVGTAAALLLVALGTSAVQLTTASLESRIQEARRTESDLASKLKAGQPELSAAGIVGDWKTRDVPPLNQLVQLNELMQGTERMYVSEYRYGPANGDAIAKLAASGNARERSDWQQMAQRLVDTHRFRVRPREQTQVSRDPDYSQRFDLDADLIQPSKPAPEKSTSTSTNSNATKGK